ncbi:MAG: TatD family hydrolase, partial [Phycisphaerales bacterium]
VLGIGEIGLNKNSRNELEILEAHLQLASDHGLLVLVHTPHLEDKLKGTRLIMDAIRRFPRLEPGRVLIDHVEEHTARHVLDRGFWCCMTLYPDTKCTQQREVDIIECYGSERIWMNSAGDWGHSDPLAVPKAQMEMRRRGHLEELVRKVTFGNPERFLSQSGRFSAAPLRPTAPDVTR